MNKDGITTIPSTSEIEERKKHGTIKDGPSLLCLNGYFKSGEICYFHDHCGQPMKALIIEIKDAVGGIANIVVDFILDGGQIVRGYIKQYSPGLSIQYGMIGSYSY